MITVLAVLAVFSVVVIIHEMGHFLVCRYYGVKVEKFAVGFGKEIFGVEWKGTRWSICILPLGGYVKPAGEEIDESSGAPDEFFGQSWAHRSAIALAGPVMNYILAFFCFFSLVFFWGQAQSSNQPVIGEVIAGFPAKSSGFLKGDRLVAINGQEISTWEDAAKVIHNQPEKPIDIRFKRTENNLEIEKTVAVVPRKDPQRNIGVIGISPVIEMERQGFFKSISLAGYQTYFWTELTLKYLGDAIVQRKKPELAGPIGIVTIIAKVSKEGFQEVLGLIALISLSLGLFNFFPIPLLDGGHVFLYLLEGISGKSLNKKMVRVANIVGATLLISIFIYATSQDISRLKIPFLK